MSLAQLVANGLIAGGIYALVALGYTMVYGVLRFINFAHGEVLMMGAYLGWAFAGAHPELDVLRLRDPLFFVPALLFYLFWTAIMAVWVWYGTARFTFLSGKRQPGLPVRILATALLSGVFGAALYEAAVHEVPLVLAFVAALPPCAGLGFVLEKACYKRLRKSHRLAPLITSIGASIFLQALALLMFGAAIQTYATGRVARGLTVFSGTPFEFVVTKLQLLIIGVSLLLMALLNLYVTYTKTGKAIRAVADNAPLAGVIGIRVDRVISIVFILGSALAAAAGILVGLEQNLTPTMGVPIGVKAFTAAVVGGIGNLHGALLGGYLIGLAENLGVWLIPSGYKDAIAFVILLIRLLLRPAGLFGVRRDEEVRA